MVTEAVTYPTTPTEAAAVKKAGALPYAGGTDLMIHQAENIRNGQCPPMVFLGGVKAFHGITKGNNELRIGPLTTMAELAASAQIPPLLSLACNAMGSPALRNIATLGGNICTASPAGDSLPALYTLDAEVKLVSPDSVRRMPVHRFITGPGKTALEPDELLAAITIPVPAQELFHYRKVSPRVANAITKVSLAVSLAVDDEIVRDIGIAFGAVGPTVIRCSPIEDACIGLPLHRLYRDRARLAAMVRDSVKPIDDLRSTALYREAVAANLFAEFLETLNHPKP